MRLVVKGGGHSYQGTSNAPDSLLVWTRRMKTIELHQAFVPQGCELESHPAVSVGAVQLGVLDPRIAVLDDGRVVVSGDTLRSSLGLRSTWVTFVVRKRT